MFLSLKKGVAAVLQRGGGSRPHQLFTFRRALRSDAVRSCSAVCSPFPGAQIIFQKHAATTTTVWKRRVRVCVAAGAAVSVVVVACFRSLVVPSTSVMVACKLSWDSAPPPLL